MPLEPRGASYHTDIIKSSAEVNAAIGGAVSRGGNSAPPRPSGALSSVVNNNIVAQIQFQLLDNMPGPPGPQGPQGPPGPSGSSSYTPIGADIWGGSPPATAEEAINRLAALLYVRTFTLGPLTPVSNNTQIITLKSSGGTDAYIVKYATDGTAQWVRRIGGVTTCLGRGISTDASGNVYVTGYYSNAATVFAADGSTAAFSLATEGNNDAFIVKYASNGTPQWARRIGGGNSDQGLAIASDASGNVCAIGFYKGPVTVFAGDGTAAFSLAMPVNNNDVFIVKYATDGTPAWVRRIGGTSVDEGAGISIDASGNVYATGYYTGTSSMFGTDASGIAVQMANATNGDAFVVKYLSDGTPQWSRRIGGGNLDQGTGISSDASGVYITGFCAGSMGVYDLNGNATLSFTNTGGSNDAFIVKYDTEGVPLWLRRIGGANGDQGMAIATDASGNVYVTGFYTGTASVFAADASGTAFSLANSGSQDAFIVKYATDGTLQWTRRIGGAGADQGTGISSDASGNVYVTGYSTGLATVFAADGSTTAFSIGTSGNTDAFIVKYASNGTPVWVRRIGGTGNDQGLAIASDASGNVFATGYYGGMGLVLGAGL